MKEEILSAGIDIGTSTTQLVFSKFYIENTATMFSVPRVTIVDKEIIYRSDIYFTPLLSQKEIDAVKVRGIIEKEYDLAGISPKDVKTGAVIITGETSRKNNAENVAEMLSGLAGDFVVATAGPDLESIIAGKGAGADRISKDYKGTVVNLDIGGGTTNISVFRRGELLDVGCLDIGGRLIKLDEHGDIVYIAEKIKRLAENRGISINTGEKADEFKIRKVATEMVRILEMSVGLTPRNQNYSDIVTNHGISSEHLIEYITLSGGVADIVYGKDADLFKYGDMGIILAQEIRKSNLVKNIKLMVPYETIRATVIGAGSHTTDISGSTIFYNKEMFPLKNIPILKLNEHEESLDRIADKIKDKINWFKVEKEIQQVAVAFRGVKDFSFYQIKHLAREIIKGLDEILNNNLLVFILAEEDIAKVLGQTIYTELEFKRDVLCIDSISVDNGDYIDVGNPVANGAVVPVVIKTLVFE